MEYHNTNNDILADCQEAIIKGDSEDTKRKVFVFINDYYKNEGVEVNNNFSHDNWKGVGAYLSKYYPDYMHLVPLFGRHSWNPLNFITFFWMKYKVTRVLLLPFISLRMILNCIFTFKRDGAGRPHTSGRLLDYFLCLGFDMPRALAAMTWCLKKFNDLENWDNIFNIYYNSGLRYNYKVLEAYNATNTSN